ncbi:dnaJ homolog subfamily B member 13-like [Leptopilina heterotoma]|uniref:dnaJ homolog subfamily B member 13-like n=1 Tax=Leptopilina heterotoma TaxID=63436 RepID=UPI001CA88227|nr:dnaJ homolog subfamily B member 13-like [Leptopilina heterotoma]
MYCEDSYECPKCIDYYGVLNLRRDCQLADIQKAFRRLAIQYNPERQKDKSVEVVFGLIAEAYDVLSDPLRRAVYDQYGEKGLKGGVPGPEGYIQPYTFHGEPLKTYREFFGTTSPYADLLDIPKKPVKSLEKPEECEIKSKEEPIIKPLSLTLSEIFFGGLKKMKIQRHVLVGEDKATTELKEKILTIHIKPGLPSGTKIAFPEQGDQGPTKIPADIIFITEDRPHEIFKRDGNNLIMTVNVFLREALTGLTVTVHTIDDRILRVPITSVITPNYQKQITGEGLPIVNNPKERGDLLIDFNIKFPVYMSVESKNYIKKAFEISSDTDSTEDTEYIHRFLLADKIRRNVDDDVPLQRSPDNELNKLVC